LNAEVTLLGARGKELAALVSTVQKTTAATLGSSTIACDADRLMNELQAALDRVSEKVGALIGEKSVVPSPPMKTGTKLLLGGLILGGGYLAYRWYRHGGVIPRKRLPRYAGGTRSLR
jgi:hypothetical protein